MTDKNLQEAVNSQIQGPKKSDEQQKRFAEEAESRKQAILFQVLTQNALARLSNLQAAKPERARQIEAMILNMATTGRLSGKMDDEQFRSLLDQISGQQQKRTTTVKFDRRRAQLDSDEDEDYE